MISRTQLHRWLAVVSLLPLLYLCITGFALGFVREMDRMAHVNLLTSPHSQQKLLSNEQQIILLNEYRPEASIMAFLPATNPVEASIAILQQADHDNRQVFMDPKSGKILGERDLMEDWLVQLASWHRMAWASSAGDWIVMFSSLGFLLLVFSGWWQQLSQAKPSTARSLHFTLGVWLTPLLVLISTSGLALWFVNFNTTHSSLDTYLHYQSAIQQDAILLGLHTGALFAMPGRFVWGASSIALIFFALSAFRQPTSHQKELS